MLAGLILPKTCPEEKLETEWKPEGAALHGLGSGLSPSRDPHVAAGLRPGVEPGILPGGMRRKKPKGAELTPNALSGRRGRALYGRPEAHRYDRSRQTSLSDLEQPFMFQDRVAVGHAGQIIADGPRPPILACSFPGLSTNLIVMFQIVIE